MAHAQFPQVDEAAQFVWDGTAELVVIEVPADDTTHGDSAPQGEHVICDLLAHAQSPQVDKAAQFVWDGAAELVFVEVAEVEKRTARRRLSVAQFQTHGCNGARTVPPGS